MPRLFKVLRPLPRLTTVFPFVIIAEAETWICLLSFKEIWPVLDFCFLWGGGRTARAIALGLSKKNIVSFLFFGNEVIKESWACVLEVGLLFLARTFLHNF